VVFGGVFVLMVCCGFMFLLLDGGLGSLVVCVGLWFGVSSGLFFCGENCVVVLLLIVLIVVYWNQ
jgi:hypothetical protein